MLSVCLDLTFSYAFSRVISYILAFSSALDCFRVSFSFFIDWLWSKTDLISSSSFLRDFMSFICSFNRDYSSSFFLLSYSASFLWWFASYRQIFKDCSSSPEFFTIFWDGGIFSLFLLFAKTIGEWFRLIAFCWICLFLGVTLFIKSLIL